MRRGVGSYCAKEGDENEPKHVEGGEHRDESADDEQTRASVLLMESRGEDGILAVEAAQQRHTRKGKGANQKSAISGAHPVAQSAHLPNVLFMVQRVNHRTGTEKQKGFEESVRGEVIHGRRRREEPHGHNHVAELRKGGVSEDALDVVLLARNQ